MKKVFKAKNLAYLIIFLLPAYLIRFKILGIPINLLECLVVLFFVQIFSDGNALENIKKTALLYRKNLIAAAIIISGLVISTLINNNFCVGLGIIKGWFVFPILFSLAASSLMEKEEDKRRILSVFYLSAVVVSLIGLMDLILGKVTFDGRLEVFFNSPNYLAMYLVPALIWAAFSFKRKKVFYAITAGLLIVNLYFTFSYTAWATLGAVFSLFLFFTNNLIKANRKIFLLVLVALTLFFIVQKGSDKLGNIKNYARSSLESRVMIWQASFKMLEDNWVLGIGPGNFQNKYLEYQKYFPPYLEWAVPHPHNLYLAFWLYGGIISLAGLLLLIFVWFRDFMQGNNANKYLLLAILLGFFIHGIFDTTYFKNDLAIIFWLVYFSIKKPSA